METYSDFTQIVEDGGKRYILNEAKFKKLSGVLDSIDTILEGVRDWLKKNDFPATGEFAVGALFDSGFLRQKMLEDTEKSNARLKLPKHIAKIHIQAAEMAAKELDVDDLNALRAEFIRIRKLNDFNIELTPDHFYMTQDGAKVERKTVGDLWRNECLRLTQDGAKVERKTVGDLWRNECLREAPQAMCEAAEVLKDAVLRLRPYMDLGAPIPEALKKWLGNYLAPSEYDDMRDILPVIAFMTVNRKASRALVRLKNRDAFYLMGGKDTEKEKELAARRANIE